MMYHMTKQNIDQLLDVLLLVPVLFAYTKQNNKKN